MYVFILSVLLVSFISLCFFKKKFWENRYLVLLISGGVAVIVTLIINYATRNNIDNRIETVWNHPIQLMNLQNSLVDSSFITMNNELSFKDHLYFEDTINTSIYSRYLFYYDDYRLRVGFAYNNDLKSKNWNNVYITKSNIDTTAYFSKQRVFYGKRNSKWVRDISLPHIKTIKCLYLPSVEYAAIPDSLIKEFPLF